MLSNIKLFSPAALEDKAMADYNAHLGESVVVHNVIVETQGRLDYRALSSPALVTRVSPVLLVQGSAHAALVGATARAAPGNPKKRGASRAWQVLPGRRSRPLW
jgi:hypothetical protein